MSYSYGKSIVTDGLVFYVDAANDNSYPGTGTTWSDLIEGNDGTLTNGPTYDSANGGSIDFDGTNDFVRVPDSAALQFGTGSFTASAWIYPVSAVDGRIINTRGRGLGGQYSGYQFRTGESGSNWGFSGCAIDDASGSIKSYTGSYVYPKNSWYYVNMVYNTQNDLKLYVNGSLDGTLTVGAYGSISNSLPTAIGTSVAFNGVEGTYGQYFGGNISNVSLHNRALTSTEILQNYNALKNRFV